MPTYVCSVPADALSLVQKAEIAKAISQRHSEATGAPTFFVQVEIDESPSRQRYLGGKLTSDHIWVRGDIRAGRTVEQRKQLMRNIVDDLGKITGIARESVWVYLCNLEPTDMIEYGHVLPQPGNEGEWFESLPEALKRYLENLGTNRDNFVL